KWRRSSRGWLSIQRCSRLGATRAAARATTSGASRTWRSAGEVTAPRLAEPRLERASSGVWRPARGGEARWLPADARAPASRRRRAILAEPAGAPDRLNELAATIQADALAASSLLEQRYARAVRFDLGTTCGPDFLDLSVVHMHRDGAQLAREATVDNGTLDA